MLRRVVPLSWTLYVRIEMEDSTALKKIQVYLKLRTICYESRMSYVSNQINIFLKECCEGEKIDRTYEAAWCRHELVIIFTSEVCAFLALVEDS